jgi:hypothetical protein
MKRTYRVVFYPHRKKDMKEVVFLEAENHAELAEKYQHLLKTRKETGIRNYVPKDESDEEIFENDIYVRE